MSAVVPYRATLQLDRPCCECGTTCRKGERTVIVVVGLRVGSILTTQLIAWCDECWRRDYRPVANQIQEMP